MPAPSSPRGRCIECGGEQLQQPDPRGLLAINHAGTCGLGNFEDSRQHADWERSSITPSWTRPVTATERALLSGLGFDGARPTYTLVDMRARVVWARSWPELGGASDV